MAIQIENLASVTRGIDQHIHLEEEPEEDKPTIPLIVVQSPPNTPIADANPSIIEFADFNPNQLSPIGARVSTREAISASISEEVEKTRKEFENARLRAHQEQINLAKKKFFIKLATLGISLFGFVVSLGIVVATVGQGAPVTIIFGLLTLITLADVCCALKDYSNKQKGLRGLPMGDDAIGNACYAIATKLGVQPRKAKVAAKIGSVSIKVGLGIAMIGFLEASPEFLSSPAGIIQAVDEVVEQGIIFGVEQSQILPETDESVSHLRIEQKVRFRVYLAVLAAERNLNTIIEEQKAIEQNYKRLIQAEQVIVDRQLDTLTNLQQDLRKKLQTWNTLVTTLSTQQVSFKNKLHCVAINFESEEVSEQEVKAHSLMFTPYERAQSINVELQNKTQRIKEEKQKAVEDFKASKLKHARGNLASKCITSIALFVGFGVSVSIAVLTLGLGAPLVFFAFSSFCISVADTIGAGIELHYVKKQQSSQEFGWDMLANMAYKIMCAWNVEKQKARRWAEGISGGVRLVCSLGALLPRTSTTDVTEKVDDFISAIQEIAEPLEEMAEQVSSREERAEVMGAEARKMSEELHEQINVFSSHNEAMGILKSVTLHRLNPKIRKRIELCASIGKLEDTLSECQVQFQCLSSDEKKIVLPYMQDEQRKKLLYRLMTPRECEGYSQQLPSQKLKELRPESTLQVSLV
ncbi:hypothetical protein D5018_15605 [Parashewanella curva]|uniref:Uncharacterized protein n=1 Tax=Parashewanella curva TaxID=2338552 RepID=A0A3L8PTQ9_9GAMM|nr:hypothetical protein [Parashewanella curva]RLV58771.1 hypothetical protein D5018_15605 [Parashewanella curva]